MKHEPATQLSTLRLELLRLAHRHDQSAEAAIGRAAAMEGYVLNGPVPSPPLADKPKGPAPR
jgi:hypothetical protein